LNDHEYCSICGDSVIGGSGKFVNRVPDLNSPEERWDMGRRFPFGDWVCAECDHEDPMEAIENGGKKYYIDLNSPQVMADDEDDALRKWRRYFKAGGWESRNESIVYEPDTDEGF
jgi:hypothetical protein